MGAGSIAACLCQRAVKTEMSRSEINIPADEVDHSKIVRSSSAPPGPPA